MIGSSCSSFYRHPRFGFIVTLTFLLLLSASLLIVPRVSPHIPDYNLWPSTPHPDPKHEPDTYGNLQQTLAYSEAAYQKKVRQRADLIAHRGGEKMPTFPEPYSDMWTMWDLFVPAFSCPFPVTRVGALGDGGKWVCGYGRIIRQQECVIYSSGVDQNSSFEKEVLDDSTSCKIWGYDFSVSNWGPEIRDLPQYQSRTFFKPYKLAAHTNENANPPEFSIQGLMKKNGHTFIDILKLDIEGWEYELLDSLLTEYEGRPLPFGQLQLEVHIGSKSFADFLHWWEKLEKAGLRPFWSEPNLVAANYYRSAPGWMEWSFINTRGHNIFY